MNSLVLMILASAPMLQVQGLQYVSFDSASASTTYSGAAFGAAQALHAGSGYWCSAGAQGRASWTGVLDVRRSAMGIKIDWAYSPGEVKVLVSSDMANFEEALCWTPSSRAEVSYEQTLMFSAPLNVKAVTIVMKKAQAWGYYGINSAVLLVEPGPFMLVSGVTSASGEQCVVSVAGAISTEPCLDAVAAGDGRDVMEFDEAGQLVHVPSQTCLTLLDGDVSGGGVLAMQACSKSPEAGDGRSLFAAQPNGQIKMPKLGNVCLKLSGGGAEDLASAAQIDATSSAAGHAAGAAVDSDATSFWASDVDPSGPVDLQLDFGTSQQIKEVDIEWEYPAQAYTIQVADGGVWSTIFTTSSNNFHTTTWSGSPVKGSRLRVRMQKPHPTLGAKDGHALYGVKGLRVSTSSSKLIVQDCVEAEGSVDASDKFFMSAVESFDPSAPVGAEAGSSLLVAAQEHLGAVLAQLHAVLPTLSKCGYVGALAQKKVGSSHVSGGVGDANFIAKPQVLRKIPDDAAAATSRMAKKLRVNSPALQRVLADAQALLARLRK